MLTIGELDRRVKLETYTTSIDDFGERDETWSEYREVWSKVVYKSGKIDEESDKITSVQKILFYIRNLSIEITTETRILYDGKYHYIEAINEIDGRDRFLEILTKEKD